MFKFMARIYCGRNMPDNGFVSTSDLEDFVNKEVTPRFPDGFTMLPGMGAWRETRVILDGETGLPEVPQTKVEQTMIFEILYSTEEQAKLIGQIAGLYKKRFKQDAVLLVTQDIAGSATI